MSPSTRTVFYCFCLASLAMATMGQNRFAMYTTPVENSNSYPHSRPYFPNYYYNQKPLAPNVQRQDILATDDNNLKTSQDARSTSLLNILNLCTTLTALGLCPSSLLG